MSNDKMPEPLCKRCRDSGWVPVSDGYPPEPPHYIENETTCDCPAGVAEREKIKARSGITKRGIMKLTEMDRAILRALVGRYEWRESRLFGAAADHLVEAGLAERRPGSAPGVGALRLTTAGCQALRVEEARLRAGVKQ